MTEVNSLGMHVRRRPAEERGTILWVHGLGESGLCFEQAASHPSLSCWLQLTPDLPGYGKSERPAAPLSLEGFADVLAEGLRHWEASPAVVIGHSMGGVIGLLLCERHPELVRAFVNIEGNVSSGDCTYSGIAAAQSSEGFRRQGFERLQRQVSTRAEADPAQTSYLRSLRSAWPEAFHANSRQLVEASQAGDVASRLRVARKRIPLLFVAGSPGGVCPETLQRLAEFEIATRIVFPSGHWPFLDRPQEFAGLLDGFLSTLPGA